MPSKRKPPPPPPATDQGPFPHRISADFSAADYDRLHRLSFELRRPKTELLRAALALVTDDQLAAYWDQA